MKNLWTVKDACAAWGLKTSRVLRLCRDGRVLGARQVVDNGRVFWVFPEQPKPEEKRAGRKPAWM